MNGECILHVYTLIKNPFCRSYYLFCFDVGNDSKRSYTRTHLPMTSCADVDECKEGKHDCSPHATCTNTANAFTCTCKAGYVGDGKQCFAEYILGSSGQSSYCPAGFKKVDKANCGVGARYAGVEAGANNKNSGWLEGSLDNAPVGCSVKVAALTTSNEWRPHWNTRSSARNDGTYRVVCVRTGRQRFGLVWVWFAVLICC